MTPGGSTRGSITEMPAMARRVAVPGAVTDGTLAAQKSDYNSKKEVNKVHMEKEGSRGIKGVEGGKVNKLTETSVVKGKDHVSIENNRAKESLGCATNEAYKSGLGLDSRSTNVVQQEPTYGQEQFTTSEGEGGGEKEKEGGKKEKRRNKKEGGERGVQVHESSGTEEEVDNDEEARGGNEGVGGEVEGEGDEGEGGEELERSEIEEIKNAQASDKGNKMEKRSTNKTLPRSTRSGLVKQNQQAETRPEWIRRQSTGARGRGGGGWSTIGTIGGGGGGGGGGKKNKTQAEGEGNKLGEKRAGSNLANKSLAKKCHGTSADQPTIWKHLMGKGGGGGGGGLQDEKKKETESNKKRISQGLNRETTRSGLRSQTPKNTHE